MPTAGRLVAAILFCALGYWVSRVIMPLFPPSADLGRFAEVNAGIALFVGWTVGGSRTGDGLRGGIGLGLTTAAMMLFWAMFLQSAGEMIRRSLRKQYDGAVEAIVGIFELMIEYGQLIATPQVILTLLLGGIAAGLVTEWSARRWS